MRGILLILWTMGMVSMTSCGDGDVCREAIEKWNTCAKSTPPEKLAPQIAWNGRCEDGVTFKTSAGADWNVPLKSWSAQYVDCSPDPATCLCPGMPYLIPEYYNPK